MKNDKDGLSLGIVSGSFGRNSIAPESVHDEAKAIFDKKGKEVIGLLERGLDGAYGEAWGNYAQRRGTKFAIVRQKLWTLVESYPLFIPLSPGVTDLAKFASEFGIPLVADGPEYDEIASVLDKVLSQEEEEGQTQNQATTNQS